MPSHKVSLTVTVGVGAACLLVVGALLWRRSHQQAKKNSTPLDPSKGAAVVGADKSAAAPRPPPLQSTAAASSAPSIIRAVGLTAVPGGPRGPNGVYTFATTLDGVGQIYSSASGNNLLVVHSGDNHIGIYKPLQQGGTTPNLAKPRWGSALDAITGTIIQDGRVIFEEPAVDHLREVEVQGLAEHDANGTYIKANVAGRIQFRRKAPARGGIQFRHSLSISQVLEHKKSDDGAHGPGFLLDYSPTTGTWVLSRAGAPEPPVWDSSSDAPGGTGVTIVAFLFGKRAIYASAP